MSHLCTIATQLKSLPAIQAACLALGWTLSAGGVVRYYAGDGPPVDYHIDLNDPALARYNIGLRRTADGFEVLLDNAMRLPHSLPAGQLGGETPRILNSLRREYAKAVILAVAKRQGRRVHQTVEADGRIRLRLSGGRH